MNSCVLGLKIIRIQAGYRDLLEINGDSLWTKKVWDIRKELPLGTNTIDGKTVLLLLGVESGTILTIAAKIAGEREGDCISAWIYIPSTIEVTGKQLVDVVEITKKELVANERNDVKLREVFERSYPVRDVPITPVVGRGEQCAYRKYGRGCKYELYELLDNPSQADYRSFKGIFLIDSASGINYYGADLTSSQLKRLVKIPPVTDIHDFKAFMNNSPMDKPIFIPEGDEVAITWKRPGYKPIDKKWIVQEGQSIPGISEPDYMILVPYTRFKVRDKKTKDGIERYKLMVNNTPLSEGAQLPVSEAAVASSQVTVRAEGYSPQNMVCDLSSEIICIYLEKEKISYDFKIPLQHVDEHFANLHIETITKLDGKSPIKGYKRDGDKLKYYPIGKTQWKYILIIFLATLILGVICGMLLSSGISKFKRSKENEDKESVTIVQKQTKPLPTSEKNQPPKERTSSAVHYLDSHEKWNRKEMEAISELVGLWDALNERRFDDILKYEEQLNGSTKFRELVVAINANKQKTFPQKFNTEASDYDITVGSKDTPRSYIKKLYDAQGSTPKKPASQDAKKKPEKKKKNDKQDNW